MDMFVDDDAVSAWENALPRLRGAARLTVLAPLAWHLRQRDSARAVRLADEALALLDAAVPATSIDDAHLQNAHAPSAHIVSDAANAALPDGHVRAALRARLQLTLAETQWLYGALDAAQALTDIAYASLCATEDHAGCSDTHWLRAWIAVDRGEHAACDNELAQAADCARLAGDQLRQDIAEAALARWDVLHDAPRAMRRWGPRYAADALQLDMPAALAVWVNDYLGLAASQSRDLGAAAGFYIRCYESALATGQLRSAINAATNTGEYFAKLNDHQAALEWMQGALDLARPTGWPRSIGGCLMYAADTMRRLGRLAAAEEMLQEALLIMAPLSNARSYASALMYLGDLCLAQGDYDGALHAFERLAQRADALDQGDFQSTARRGLAHALSYLDRPEEALAAAQTAVELAGGGGNAYNQIAALRVLAMIHARHDLPPPPLMAELNAALHYLHQAVTVASTIDGYILPGDLLDALAREYADAGLYAQAYDIALEASAARETTHSQEATNRAVAMQVHHQTERARADGLHHRALAESEARRAEVLQQTSATLERLSVIGQEITAHLEAAAVFRALDRHVHALLPVSTFAVYLTDAAGARLTRAFGVEQGRALPNNSIPLDHPSSFAARCMVERRELYIEHVPAGHAPFPGTIANLCGLYVPLMVGDRVLGVMTVQERHAAAYGERERLIFRTLCSYGAIALDNANAYRQLQDAQTQLVSQEKLAALGALMAGVAHELNTPIGNSLLIASTLQEKTTEVERLLNGPGLRRSELAGYIADAGRASELVLRGLHTAADLVNSFKQVAVDRTTEQRRGFNLQQVAYEILATLMNRIRNGGHRIDVEIADDIVMDSYPGPLGQVVTNLINNALLHAFAPGVGGSMWLRGERDGDGRVRLTFRDNGAGIPAEHCQRIFDPFFTTKLGQGGSGLGLSISYNIVTSLLGGQISVDGDATGGACFVLDLPLVAPQHDPAKPASIY